MFKCLELYNFWSDCGNLNSSGISVKRRESQKKIKKKLCLGMCLGVVWGLEKGEGVKPVRSRMGTLVFHVTMRLGTRGEPTYWGLCRRQRI
jgi:hypothetical protein